MKLLFASALLFAVLLPAHAQETDVEAQELKERDRIKSERSAVEQRFKVEEQLCRQKFAVNDCVDRAKRSRSADLADLRRQELVINEAERKRRAAAHQRDLDERNSQQQQQQAAERRAKALQETRDREERFNEKAAKRAADQADRAGHASTKTAKPATVDPQGKPRASRAFSAPQPAASEAGANRARYEAHQKEAAEHKAAVLEREAKRTKPAASGLPAPAN